MNIYLFENRDEALNLEPISLTRPVFDLRCGAFTFLERIQKEIKYQSISFFVRDEMEAITQDKFRSISVNPKNVNHGIWLNATVLWDKNLFEKVATKENTLYFSSNQLVAANLDEENGQLWIDQGGPVKTVPSFNLSSVQMSVGKVQFLWDCINKNSEMILKDSGFFEMGRNDGFLASGVTLLNSGSIVIGSGSKIMSSTVLDAEDGPIIIGENVTVLPNSFLQGPLVIGDDCLIKAGAKIYEGTTIGPTCKVGGEVEESIFQGFSNKQHDGFLGHAYIGEWVNMGADTNNSDLKNNYTHVKVTINGEVVDTKSLFVGLFMGDHSKSGINTMFNTGTVIGPCTNVVGYGFPPKTIPPFSWVIDGKIRTHLFEKFVETATVVKKRRGHTFTTVEKTLYKWISEHR
ncbi:MAG: hypothetical protein IID16_02275 [Candidatus Marinimicrobia bacterium]|nr:hypothetical protein [Candidatus Neomarinimicrobiota bacterium]